MHNHAHFRVFGIPVRVEVLFWLITGVLGYSLGSAPLIITWIAVVFVSVLLHELGHGIALKVFGQPSSIVLHGFGGLTFSPRRLAKGQSIVVSLAGPLAALLLLGLPMRALRDSETGLEFAVRWIQGGGGFGIWPAIWMAAYINVWWSLFNLVPIRPLDGGAIMTEVLGLEKARLASIVFGAGAAAYLFIYEDTFEFAGFFAAMLAFINFREYQQAKQGVRAPSTFDIERPDPGGRPPPRSTRRGPSSPLRSVPTYETPTMPSSPPVPGALDVESATSLAWNAVRVGEGAQARRIVARASGPVSPFLTGTISVLLGEGPDRLVAAYRAAPDGPSNLVPATVVADHGDAPAFAQLLLEGAGAHGVTANASLQTHLHYAERFAASATVGEVLYAAAPPARAQVAFDVACAWSRAGEPARSVLWVARAIDDGFRSPALIDGERDLAQARKHPDWAAVRAKLD